MASSRNPFFFCCFEQCSKPILSPVFPALTNLGQTGGTKGAAYAICCYLLCHRCSLARHLLLRHVPMRQLPAMFTYLRNVWRFIDNNVGRWHMFRSGKQAETTSLLHGLSLRHDDRQPRERHSRGCLVFTSSPAVCLALPHRRRDYDALLSGCCPCAPLSASSRISATGLNATPRREGPDGASVACSGRAATSSSASFCAASPAGRR